MGTRTVTVLTVAASTAALEAKIINLTCNEAPTGAARWTLSLLNETLVALTYGPAISNETIRNVLKKQLKP